MYKSLTCLFSSPNMWKKFMGSCLTKLEKVWSSTKNYTLICYKIKKGASICGLQLCTNHSQIFSYFYRLISLQLTELNHQWEWCGTAWNKAISLQKLTRSKLTRSTLIIHDLKMMTTVLRKWHRLKLCLTHFLINLHLVD